MARNMERRWGIFFLLSAIAAFVYLFFSGGVENASYKNADGLLVVYAVVGIVMGALLLMPVGGSRK